MYTSVAPVHAQLKARVFDPLTHPSGLLLQIGKAFHNTMVTESDYVGEDYEVGCAAQPSAALGSTAQRRMY